MNWFISCMHGLNARKLLLHGSQLFIEFSFVLRREEYHQSPIDSLCPVGTSKYSLYMIKKSYKQERSSISSVDSS